MPEAADMAVVVLDQAVNQGHHTTPALPPFSSTMSTPSSPPSSASYIPYQAYKSKRHSRNLSNPPNPHLVPNQSLPPVSKPSNGGISSATFLNPPKLVLQADDDNVFEEGLLLSNGRANGSSASPLSKEFRPSEAEPSISPPREGPISFPTVSEEGPGTPPSTDGVRALPKQATPDESASASPSPTSSRMQSPTPRKTSTFRKLPAKSARNTPASPHVRNMSLVSLPPTPGEEIRSLAATPLVSPSPLPHAQLPPVNGPSHTSRLSVPFNSHILPAESSSILQSPASVTIPLASPPIQTHKPLPSPQLAAPQPTATRKPAPYRPGFQPRGVYRPLTDEFLEIRKRKRDGEGEGGMKRVERTKLERRLEKLISLHFPAPGEEGYQEKARPSPRPLVNGSKRASSIFDFQTLKNISLNDAGDLWKGVVTGALVDSAKNDIRAAEQRITPWQDDAEVTKCPLCVTSFHPLTCRKHHCRLCGRIICSLPVKHPQRKALCSILFIVDKQSRQVEEVGEGVDYGVRKRKPSTVVSQAKAAEEEEKFLKGVRICRECRPIVLRQQYRQQTQILPPFVDLYQQFVALESDIEEALPKFEELLMTLNHQNDQPTKEASAARKKLLDCFAQYDRLAKKIRALPCSNGAGSSQERVQMAIMTRASLFLQKNMFPLQAIPTPTPKSKAPESKTNGPNSLVLPPDMDAALAHTLQPLLEQEAILENFVEEAQAQRKFEDVKTLKINLKEIRKEIERRVDDSDAQR
ncbi:hypothetical protein CPB83DRAFT_847611 [Crepidotus variabilis]|uniref:FYVE-type domain-containing protein n=1 Tax=Crepidotus variabilis TaxID=179855 RepID=A0A9P6EPG3_9AGAR|nr:hypothetical protein CPB83DRAFT_847611 [Crepidotus variabilis]